MRDESGAESGVIRRRGDGKEERRDEGDATESEEENQEDDRTDHS